MGEVEVRRGRMEGDWGARGVGVSHAMHDRGHIIIYPRIPTMPERKMSGFPGRDRHWLFAPSCVKCRGILGESLVGGATSYQERTACEPDSCESGWMEEEAGG